MKSTLLLTSLIIILLSCAPAKSNSAELSGDWELIEIVGVNKSVAEMFKLNAPFLSFSIADKTIFGNNGCNRFSGNFEIKANALYFSPIAMTKMACAESEEFKFDHSFSKVNKFTIENDGKTLNLFENEIVVMRLKKRK